MRSFHDFLDEMAAGLKSVERWRRYPNRKHRDDDLQHAFQTAFLAMAMLEFERAAGSAEGLDGERIIAAGFTHDLGEWVTGDVIYDVKNDPRVKAHLQDIEDEIFERDVLGRLPTPVADAVRRNASLALDRESRSGRFFNAVEHVGYMLFAIREWRGGDRDLGRQVLTGHLAKCEQYREEFAGFRAFYDPIRDEVRSAVGGAYLATANDGNGAEQPETPATVGG